MEAREIHVETQSVGSFDSETASAQQPGTYDSSNVFLPAENFMQILAHEMRGPLAPLRAAGALLRRAASDPDRVIQVAGILDRQVTTMARLIDDVLDAFRLRLGNLAIHAELVDLVTVVETAVESTLGFAESRGHALITTLPQHALEVICDPDRVSQVIENLVTNAAKYTNRGGMIEVRVDGFSDCASVSVIDDGIGLSAADIGCIFELYGQAGQSGTQRSEGGLGIGLFLARSLVEAQGGTLDAFSAGRGHGSEFVVRLPRSRSSL